LNVEEIKALVALFEASSLSELSLQREHTQLVLKRPSQAAAVFAAPRVAPSPPSHAQAAPSEALPQPDQASGHAVNSPLVGTFYRRPSPEEAPYVEVGTAVKAGDTLCLVEAMKVMNEIKADVPGVVRQICAEDGSVVEYGQVLVVIDPA